MGNLPPSAEMAKREQDRLLEQKNIPAGDATVPTKRLARAVVDTEQEIAVQVLYSTVVFRPNQEIKDARLLQIAKDHGVPIRYK